MSEQTFDDRLAALEEHIVAPEPASAETFLAWAEEALADGDQENAHALLRLAKTSRVRDMWAALAERSAAEDDDA